MKESKGSADASGWRARSPGTGWSAQAYAGLGEHVRLISMMPGLEGDPRLDSTVLDPTATRLCPPPSCHWL